MWNKANTRFASYAKNHGNNSGQYYYHIVFYKKSGGVSYEDYIAKCCTPLGSINGSVNWSKELEDIESPNSFNIYLVYFSMSKIAFAIDMPLYTCSTCYDCNGACGPTPVWLCRDATHAG